jgi:hypothetical protein
VHPIERLRYVARSSGADQRVLVRETAMALRGLRGDHTGLVVSCRRIIERHPRAGALWSLSARALTATDPHHELGTFSLEVEHDRTPDHLYDALPEGATVCVLGWPDLIAEAVFRRGDVRVLSVDVLGEGSGFVQRLQRADIDAEVIPPAAIGSAAASADVVLLEASAAGPDGILAVTGSRAAAAVAYCSEIPVWAVVGLGRRLPAPMWQSVIDRLVIDADPVEADDEIVPAGTISHLIGPSGFVLGTADLDRPECPSAPELLRITGH